MSHKNFQLNGSLIHPPKHRFQNAFYNDDNKTTQLLIYSSNGSIKTSLKQHGRTNKTSHYDSLISRPDSQTSPFSRGKDLLQPNNYQTLKYPKDPKLKLQPGPNESSKDLHDSLNKHVTLQS